MTPLRRIQGVAIPFDRINVDTDLIISSDHLKGVNRTGLGKHAFEDLRANDPENVFDSPRNRGAPILLTGIGFGSGSSREHAAWALSDMGIRCVIGPGFADIFAGNAFKNGIAVITLPSDHVDQLMMYARDHELDIGIEEQEIVVTNGKTYHFELDAFRKHCLMSGLDEISLTEQDDERISLFERNRAHERSFVDSRLVNGKLSHS
ncbi:3-isopropylmalate dehydratase small subunit [uncultured Erythrobacter sp.]|uniref:3-isopropylmalate dehydratase small subunit n=1 Tax=uncultured Erythrobacter sp. TaxID=263913 RepID=UPI0026386E31|nr:3-isopropylmalate dehydratase small subunit [uncultured Erythrobacter sp.]